MVRLILVAMLASFVGACSTMQSSDTSTDELVIHDISQGKMRKENGKYVVYEHTDDMVYEENDRCTYNKETIDCLRHGFIIEYDSHGEGLTLDCVAKTNVAVNAGNVAREKYVDTRKDDFYMPLEASESEFVNVQYISGQPGLEDLQIETSCSYKDKEVFKLKQRVRFDREGA